MRRPLVVLATAAMIGGVPLATAIQADASDSAIQSRVAFAPASTASVSGGRGLVVGPSPRPELRARTAADRRGTPTMDWLALGVSGVLFTTTSAVIRRRLRRVR